MIAAMRKNLSYDKLMSVLLGDVLRINLSRVEDKGSSIVPHEDQSTSSVGVRAAIKGATRMSSAGFGLIQTLTERAYGPAVLLGERFESGIIRNLRFTR